MRASERARSVGVVEIVFYIFLPSDIIFILFAETCFLLIQQRRELKPRFMYLCVCSFRISCMDTRQACFYAFVYFISFGKLFSHTYSPFNGVLEMLESHL